MKKKGFEIYLYSTVGVGVMLAIVVAFNFITALGKQRIDLTEERAYTLSAGTRQILSKIDTPVQIRFYCSRGDNAMPVFLKTYAQRVEDLLGEFRQGSKGQIEIQKLDPLPDSDAEDSARLDGVEGQMLQLGDAPIYLGVSINMLDQTEVIPFLNPDRERLLEYDLARAISRVITPEKAVVGVMSPMPVSGRAVSPMMMQQGRRGGEPPWVIMSELQRDFTVKPVEMTADIIPDDIKTLVLIHPKAISDATQYAIDQFVLRGGKLIAFLDPISVLDTEGAQMGGMPGSSNLDKLLKAWGLTFDTTKIVADKDYIANTQQGRAPTFLVLTEKAVNKDDVLTADSDNLHYVYGGAFTGTPADGLTQTVLIKSSKNSQLVDPMLARFGGEQIIKDFVSGDKELALAVRLTGKFKTAFPDGRPKKEEASPEGGKPEEKKEEPAAEPGLKESSGAGVVILVGDSDMIQDKVAVDVGMNPFGGQRVVMPKNSNLAFAQGAVEQLTGDSNLIGVRSRASRERPFTVVKEIQAKAESNYQSKIKELEGSLAEAQRKLNELQQTKTQEGGQKMILSPEQQQEIAKFRQKESEVKKQLKEERRKLRADIDSLENNVKWLNIAGMPILVSFAGVGLALIRRKRRAAR